MYSIKSTSSHACWQKNSTHNFSWCGWHLHLQYFALRWLKKLEQLRLPIFYKIIKLLHVGKFVHLVFILWYLVTGNVNKSQSKLVNPGFIWTFGRSLSFYALRHKDMKRLHCCHKDAIIKNCRYFNFPVVKKKSTPKSKIHTSPRTWNAIYPSSFFSFDLLWRWVLFLKNNVVELSGALHPESNSNKKFSKTSVSQYHGLVCQRYVTDLDQSSFRSKIFSIIIFSIEW